ncbi:MAG: sugar transferase [Chlamydiales bacterium]|nr:sugar transferase [Chlamydiales bacterium]
MDFVGSHTSYAIEQPVIPKRHIKHSPLKRAFDIAFSLCAIIIGLPLYALLALVVKLSSTGKVIFGHERVGRGGKIFKCYKFRTMYPNADQMLESVLNESPALRAEWDICRKLTNDPRITPIGHILRKTKLDEIPQFWNVLVGDLSIVGPRPVCADEIQKYYGVKSYKILSVRPGITGLWQTSDRREMTYQERINLDEQYIDRQNFFLDLLLVLKTIPTMVRPRGAS